MPRSAGNRDLDARTPPAHEHEVLHAEHLAREREVAPVLAEGEGLTWPQPPAREQVVTPGDREVDGHEWR